jgi:type IX secretion system PorP/SprF family membrane protein
LNSKILIFIFCCLASLKVFGQQDAIISQYYFNPMFINPAYAGSKETISAILIYRNQWVGIDGAPVTQTFSIQGPNKKKNMGFGLQIFNDVVGPLRNTGIIFTYAYRISLGRGKLAFGVQPSFSQYGINWSKVKTQDQVDPAFMQNNDFKLVPDADFGIYYSANTYFGGFSMSHMIQNSLFSKGSAHAYRHMYFLAGAVIKVNKSINLRPSALVRYVEGAPIRSEINLAALFVEKFWFGMGLKGGGNFIGSKADNQLTAVVEYNLSEKLRFGYSYDMDLQQLGKYNSGSHEVMLGYNFSMYKSKMLVPRYF